MLLFLVLSSFFISLFVYYFSFRFPNFLVFISIFVNILSVLVIVYKFGDVGFLKTLVR